MERRVERKAVRKIRRRSPKIQRILRSWKKTGRRERERRTLLEDAEEVKRVNDD